MLRRRVPPPADAGFRRLWPYLREHRGALAVVAVLAAVTAATSLAQPLLVGRVVTAVQDATPVLPVAATLVAILVGGALVGALQSFLLQRTAEGLVLSTRRTLAERMLTLPVAQYDARRTGDLMSRIGADTTLLRAVVTSGLFEIVSSVVIVVGAAVAMALVDLVLLGLALLAVAIGAAVIAVASRRIRALSTLAQVRVGEMTAAVERALSAVRTIRASGATDREVDGVSTAAGAAYAVGVRAARLQAVVSPAVTIATQGSFIAVLGIGGSRVAAGVLTVGELVSFVLYLFLLVLPLARLAQTWTQLQTGLGALARIEEVVVLRGESEGDVAAAPAPAPTAPALELRDVDFTHADGTAVLHGVGFTVPRGTRTALVGPSGAGKSTVFALVERFYDVTGGAVLVDGIDVRDRPRDELRARLGYVEQDSPALAGTLRENLALAAPGVSEADQIAVLAAVNLTDLVARSPLGLDTPVGEGGVLLSGGERQRLAIARTLLAEPSLMLLDEPTASLDARNEQALKDAIDVAAQADRTLLIVAHRLSTVVDCDQIVVLDDGRVAATGTHQQLLEHSPLYAELARSQLLLETP
ncbi:MAG: Efflux ABC transporter, permease/ATP-binding protein SCO3235 [uncultured Actinomycetospora sp.]|uniref:Efflux ABC transporter, permease/ATP-binding protein SCO3235 n=1 Tax=uncultured Actinomycetospora sp. TaxID=1135996 RepID=A0A6J4J519_9PSEU|nr:MAG: Efflux ABC transporter, permease/ATP-binding protein SCO3235 [uncultured Actinomycetospora sp.]